MSTLVVPDHLTAFLLATIASWATIGATRTYNDVSGPARLKLVAIILIPLIWAASATSIIAVLLYYLAGFIVVYGVIYGIAFLFTAANYGVGTTLRAVLRIITTGDQHTGPERQPATGRQQHRQQRQTGSQHSAQRYPPRTGPQDEPIVFEDQL